MKDRIKQVREAFDFTMEKFGERLGVTRATISRLEKGERNLTEQMFKSICREFNVNDKWLRSGEGEMFNTFSDDERYAVNVGKLQRADDETIMRWVNAIAETDPEALKEVEIFLKKILDIKN